MLSGVFFLVIYPALQQAKAGFFSSILRNEAYAEVDALNSQTMELLEAEVLYVLAFNDAKTKEDGIDESASVNIVSDNALMPATGPIHVSGSDSVKVSNDVGGSYSDQISIYVIRDGDSLSEIAEMFDVSVSTILSANDMKKGEKIAPSEVLLILPISGLEHTVATGQTLQSIAKLYKVEIDDILEYNDITKSTTLSVGDELMIPGGEMADEGGNKPAPNLAASAAKDQNYYASNPTKSAVGYFVNPVPTGRKTQGLHGPGHRGIDLGAPKGTPIYAAASGRVLIAKTGWSGGYGNMAIIEHPNGTKTLYAHMNKLGTSTGAEVTQGQIIGYVGSTGHSTGPHLHFEVFNAKNPGADWSWKI